MSGARNNQIHNLLLITQNHVPYDGFVHQGDFRYKGKDVVDDGLTFDGDKSTINYSRLRMLVSDANLLPHGQLVEKVKCFSKYVVDDVQFDNKETNPANLIRTTTHMIFQILKKQKLLIWECLIRCCCLNCQPKNLNFQ